MVTNGADFIASIESAACSVQTSGANVCSPPIAEIQTQTLPNNRLNAALVIALRAESKRLVKIQRRQLAKSSAPGYIGWER
jgi:hypothetical protein